MWLGEGSSSTELTRCSEIASLLISLTLVGVEYRAMIEVIHGHSLTYIARTHTVNTNWLDAEP